MADPTESENTALRVVLAVIAALAVVALLAYARGDPGDDGRAPDPEDAAVEAPPDEAE